MLICFGGFECMRSNLFSVNRIDAKVFYSGPLILEGVVREADIVRVTGLAGFWIVDRENRRVYDMDNILISDTGIWGIILLLSA
jgi:hypothetical protein